MRDARGGLTTTTRRTLLAGGASALALLALGRMHRSDTALAAESQSFKFTKSDAEWRAALTPIQYEILRRAGTEPAGTSPLDAEDRPGPYDCVGCAQPLYTSATKFHSGTGWPSFYAPIDGAVGTTVDRSFLMERTEVHCSNCGGHLGHVFDDGPKPTGLRYCMNGAVLSFHAA